MRRLCLLLGLAWIGCSSPPSLTPPENVAWVAVIEEDISGLIADEGRFEPVEDLEARPPDFAQRQYVLGYTEAVISGLDLSGSMDSAVRPLTDPCEPELPPASWGVRIPGDGGPQVELAQGGLPRLTASWLGPRCSGGYACVQGVCEARVAEVVAGQHHACARLARGEVGCWGLNEFQQVGLPGQSFVTEVAGLSAASPARQIVAGGMHTCVLKEDGEVWCWGNNGSGQLGSSLDVEVSTAPLQVPGIEAATSIAAGADHACALLAPDDVRCWGNNASGQLGDGTTQVREGPVRVPNLEDVVQLAAGLRHTCARTSGGQVQCWGEGESGELGLQGGPAPSRAVAIERDAQSLSIGSCHSCVHFEQGEVLCWGRDHQGQLGGGLVPLAQPAVGVRAGGDWSCAWSQDGHVECWGYNRYGQRLDDRLGVFDRVRPTALDLPEPVRDLALGERFGCALTQDKHALCWGWNGFGQLGNASSEFLARPASAMLQPTLRVAAGEQHTCLLASTGRVLCFGANFFAELGQGTRGPWGAAKDAQGLGLDTVDMGAGEAHTCSLKSTGEVYCWGHNWAQQAGPAQVGVTDPQPQPDVSAASHLAVGWNHNCAVVGPDNAVSCWGDNGTGQLGRDTQEQPAGPGLVPGVQGVLQLAAGWRRTCALDGLGTVRCWGNGEAVTDLGLTGVAEVQLGRFYGCARFDDGKVSCWGANDHGQLGDGSQDDFRQAPAPVVGLEDATALFLGSAHACALREGGALVCWGDNEWHQLGDGERADARVPQPVAGVQGPVVAVGLGVRHTVVVNEAGQVYAWGWNALGQAGLPPTGVGQPPGHVVGLP